jgi:hypothetical protein
MANLLQTLLANRTAPTIPTATGTPQTPHMSPSIPDTALPNPGNKPVEVMGAAPVSLLSPSGLTSAISGVAGAAEGLVPEAKAALQSQLVTKYLSKLGQGVSNAVSIPSMSPFQKMLAAGAFRGGRTVQDVGGLSKEAPGGYSDVAGLLSERGQVNGSH